MRTRFRYFLMSLGVDGLTDIGWSDDFDEARVSAHCMSLCDPFSSYAVFDAWAQKIVSQWFAYPANVNDRRTA